MATAKSWDSYDSGRGGTPAIRIRRDRWKDYSVGKVLATQDEGLSTIVRNQVKATSHVCTKGAVVRETGQSLGLAGQAV